MAQQQMSLFGPSLAQAQAGLMQEDEAITSKLAQLTPEQQLTRVALQGGRQAGRALGGLFGIEDPRLKEAAQQEAIFKELKDNGVDFKDPEKLYSALSDAYQARGMVDKAIVTAAKLEDIKATKLKSEAEFGLKSAQTTKALAEAAKAQREQISSPFGKVDPDKFTPESLNKFQQTGNYQDLVPVEPTKFSDPYLMAGADGKQILVQKNLRTGEIGPVDKASRVSVSATSGIPPQEAEFQKEIGKEDAKAVVEARKLRTTAIGELGSLNEMAQRNAQGVTSGTFAAGRVGVANFFNTIGLLGAQDIQKLANSEVYSKSAGDLVLAKIKALGSNPSNADRDFVARIVPQLENSPQARAELIAYLQKRANDVVKEATNLESYARQNKGLSGYTPTIPLTISPQTTKKASDMTDQELIDAYKSGRR
jgi:hypothetical protein